MAARRFRDAKTLLEVALRKMPADWTAIRSVDQQRGLRQRGHEGDKEIAFWSQDEFLAYAQSEQRKEQGTIYWVPESYSRAWAQLAFILVEEKDYLEALRCLTRGLQLEPNHPSCGVRRDSYSNRCIGMAKRCNATSERLQYVPGHLELKSPGRCVARAST